MVNFCGKWRSLFDVREAMAKVDGCVYSSFYACFDGVVVELSRQRGRERRGQGW